jgi:hypothetical protein
MMKVLQINKITKNFHQTTKNEVARTKSDIAKKIPSKLVLFAEERV